MSTEDTPGLLAAASEAAKKDVMWESCRLHRFEKELLGTTGPFSFCSFFGIIFVLLSTSASTMNPRLPGKEADLC